MSAATPITPIGARTAYRVHSLRVSKAEEYLIRWKTEPELPVPPRAICSWHAIGELTLCLHYVQTYIESLPLSQRLHSGSTAASSVQSSRKRKSPDSDPLLSRDSSHGLLTPRNSTAFSREQSVVSISSSSDASGLAGQSPDVYNGVLQKKEGRITAKKSRDASVVTVNAKSLPTEQMELAATRAPVSTAVRLIREAFDHKLKVVPNVRLENTVDDTTPSLDFTFIKEFVLRDGVVRADSETNEGCQRPCRPNMGQGIGCEYTKLCTCLEYAAVHESGLQKQDEALYAEYIQQKEAGEFIDTTDLPKRFPYKKPNLDERIPSTLMPFYLNERYPIYECNLNCNCGPICKSRVVQKGRKVPLTIFKTESRGWGVYCDEDLVRGEFVDTYLGEVITNEEADRREATAGKDKASYLYCLDKFVGDEPELTADTCYIVDGQHMGSVTRFINHCCEPNCRQYTVSYNKHDLRIYELAFFAYEDIPKGTELTFDYMDKDEEEEEDVLWKREAAANDPENHDKKPCNCGAKKCRGYLWV